MLKFYVWNVSGLSLLIPTPSGVIYANQTGGFHCLESSLESILLPLVNTFEDTNPEQILHEHFVSKYHGWCGDGIDMETADFADEVFQSTPYTSWLKVDRDRLTDCHEAWICVRPIQHTDTETIEFGAFRFETAVVTWRNSD